MATGQENPGKFQAYDPSNPAPYQAPVMPEPAQAMPSPLPQQGPEINGAVKKSGAIATVADGILRGFMQGRAYHQAAQVMKLKKKSDDLQNSYNQDAVRLYQLTQAGVDPGSDSYKAAKSSVDGSWGALQDFYGQHIEQMNGEKKGKGKKNQPQLPPQAVLTNPNSTPYEKAQAWYQVAKQAGPPVYGQIAMLNTPEAQQRRKIQQQGMQNQVAGADLESAEISVKKAVTDAQGTVYKLGGQASEYEKIPEANRTPAQKEVVDQYNSARRIMDESQRRGTGAAHLYQSPDSKSQEYYTPGNEPEGWQPAQKAPTPTEEKRTDYDTAVKGGYKGSFEQWTAEETARGHRLGAPPKAGTGAGGGKGMEGSYQKALAYYKEEYPDMPEDKRLAFVGPEAIRKRAAVTSVWIFDVGPLGDVQVPLSDHAGNRLPLKGLRDEVFALRRRRRGPRRGRCGCLWRYRRSAASRWGCRSKQRGHTACCRAPRFRCQRRFFRTTYHGPDLSLEIALQVLELVFRHTPRIFSMAVWLPDLPAIVILIPVIALANDIRQRIV